MTSPLAPSVKLEGRELDAGWLTGLVDLAVDREYRVPARAVLRFADPGYQLSQSTTAALGRELVVADGEHTLFDGEVTGITVEQRAGEQPELVLVAHDRGARLGRGGIVTAYAGEQGFHDVLRRLAPPYGLSVCSDHFAETFPYVLQVDSDLALLTAFADRLGCDWWVTGRTLHFHRPGAGCSAPGYARKRVELKIGEDLHSFSVRASGLRPDSVEVNGWDRRRQELVRATATEPAAHVRSTSPLATKVATPRTALGDARLAAPGPPAATAEEAAQLSSALLTQAVASSVTARGELPGTGAIAPGVTVQVTGGGPLEGSYEVTRVEHTFRPRSGFSTRFTAGDRRPTTLVDTLAGPGTRGLRHAGLLVGQVTNVRDEQRSGRVKVRFPGLSQDHESAWARLLAPGGGKDRGMVFVPEVGDEVLLGFEGDDLRQPVVLGGLYGDRSTIPRWDVDDSSGNVSSRGFTSRLGHVIEMGDGAGPDTQHLLLALAGSRTRLRLGEDKGDLTVPEGVPFRIAIGSSSGLEFDGQGGVTLTGTTITLSATSGVVVRSTGEAELTAQGPVKVQGATVTVKGQSMSEVSGAVLMLKGDLVKIN